MEFVDVVMKRRAVRRFQEGGVDRDVIERIARLAQRAPSAGFSQGQRLIVVTDAERRREVARLLGEDEYQDLGMGPWISECAAQFIPCVSEQIYHRRYQEPDKVDDDGAEIAWLIPYWWVDAGAALMLVLLAAVDEGLAAGFFGTHRLRGLSDLLGLPESMVPIGVVTIGRPAPDRRSGSLARGPRPDQEVVHYDRWGQRKPTG